MPTITFTYTYAYRLFTGGGQVMGRALSKKKAQRIPQTRPPHPGDGFSAWTFPFPDAGQSPEQP